MKELIDGVELIRTIKGTNGILELKTLGILIIFVFLLCMVLGVIMGLILEDIELGIQGGGGMAILLSVGLMMLVDFEMTLLPKNETQRYEVKLTSQVDMEEFSLRYKIIKQTKDGKYIIEEIIEKRGN